MTPQEASEELKEEFEIFKNCINKADWENPDEELRKIIEANSMAIKALEDKGYEQGYKDGYIKGFEEGVVLG